MTKREICERLLILYADVNSLQTQIGVWNEPLDVAERDIRKAILDLAAPEEEPEPETPEAGEKEDHFADLGKKGATLPYGTSINLCGQMKTTREELKAEEKHPGIIVDPKGVNPPRCLRCGRDAEVVSYIGRGEEWAVCSKCGCAYRIKRGKDEK